MHRRLGIRLPIECRSTDGPDGGIVRAITRDISAGGVCLEIEGPAFRLGEQIQVDVSLPASEGVAPYPGRAACLAEIVRMDLLHLEGKSTSLDRYRVAARFLEPLRVRY